MRSFGYATYVWLKENQSTFCMEAVFMVARLQYMTQKQDVAIV